MQRQFRHPYAVRYDEGDCYGLLTPAAFLRYMQDIAALDAEDAQLSGDGYWVARRTIISFASPVPLHTQLELTTFGIGFTRITAQRGYVARIVGREQEEPVVTARTLWVYLDMRGRPTRLPERTAQIWLPDGPLPQQPEALWPAVPHDLPHTVIHTVRFSDIDSMKHMNNAAYVEALDNAAWEAYSRAGILPDVATINALDYDIEYVESARFAEQLEIQSWLDPFPVGEGEFSRIQQVRREGVVVVRARSRWMCRE
jgi:acyl-CoA thioesterase FadM